MNPIEFVLKLRPYNKRYKAIFGYVPCDDDYACSREEYFNALLEAIETKQDISNFIQKKVLDYNNPNKRY